MFDTSLEGVTTYVEKRYGPKAATVAGDLLLMAIFSGALAIIGATAYGGFNGAKMLIEWAAARWPQSQWSVLQGRDFAPALAVFAAMVPALYLVHRRSKRGEERLIAVTDSFFKKAVFPRIEALENLQERVSALENHTDISGSRQRLTEILSTQAMLSAGYSVTIELARFGIGPTASESVDVADTLRGYIKNGRIDILVDKNTLKVHPFRGQAKRLYVTYSINGAHRRTITVSESEKLVLPPDGTMGDMLGMGRQ